ncbi:MAG TPA: ribonuclease HI family protein [Vicinamibacteria bacterium]
MSGASASPIFIYIDGASRGNPGEAGFGVHVADGSGAERAALYGYLGRASNNVAEYQALIHALRWALGQGERRVKVFSDSELVVRQIEGRYKVKHPDMIPLHREASSLLRQFESASVSHVRREQNREADRLANQALDEKASKLA